MINEVIKGDCEKILLSLKDKQFFNGIHLTFLDPPFNQGKKYNSHMDSMPEEEYWNWMERVIEKIYELTVDGGAIYFMQREKNTEYVLRTLRETGWTFQNLIIWSKLTSAIPSKIRFSKKFQIIAFFTKGKPLAFNSLRYEPPLLAMHEYERETGMYVTDIWDDIRELTSGFFAGEEAIRIKNDKLFTKEGERFHKQQSPIELLTRIILSSSKPGDFILDPFAGTGVTSIVAKQLERNSISIELDTQNIDLINKRLALMRQADNIEKFQSNYAYTSNLEEIWKQGSSHDDSKVENYNFEDIQKIKLNNILLMKETVKNSLINEFNIPKEKIKFDYRYKDDDKKVHRFELIVHCDIKKKVIFRLIYAKSLNQADLLVKKIILEKNLVKKKNPEFFIVFVISGVAFKNKLNEIDLENNECLIIPFFGWEKVFSIPSFSQSLKDQKIFKFHNKQTSLNGFS
ncbi:hypothetical protein LCGC14_0491810 [marine sediment metagenome]|uniref:DNA methylase N-4/N-6 domain-containing protein n=1 Tax=marine sediment metagenome TaxID=412755 RepID=A0A0F9VF68_9ZZZZ|nr:site-specific DNA-methyltransferase [archaeon]